MKVAIYGASDDLVEISVNGKDDEIGCYSSDKCPSVNATLLVASIGGARAVHVHCIYNGCWSFAVSQVEEDRSLPPWTFGIEHGTTYSTKLTIDTGDDAVTVERIGGDE